MTTPLQSLINTGTKVWMDSVDPAKMEQNRSWGITGATSNPKIVHNLIETGHFDESLSQFLHKEPDDEKVAWLMTDMLVQKAQHIFQPVWEQTTSEDGYVSFELDPLLEDPERNLAVEERTQQYIHLGKYWSEGHTNRMIKVPNTEGGLAALEELAAAGVTLNVTLTFTPRQYIAARDAIWRGAQQRKSLDGFKSVYSIFVSRVDSYTRKHLDQLSPATQGQVGIINAKRIWQMNQEFWAEKKLPLKQEIVFASTGPKHPDESPWKYVEAFAGSDIETNPPDINEAIMQSDRTFQRQVDQLAGEPMLREMDSVLDMEHMERVLMEEGIKKFADPQKALLTLIANKRAALAPAAR